LLFIPETFTNQQMIIEAQTRSRQYGGLMTAMAAANTGALTWRQ
jgi:hypothetical protein